MPLLTQQLDNSRQLPHAALAGAGPLLGMPNMRMPTPKAPVHILLIDDDLALGQLLREYAVPEGFRISVAATGESGLEAVEQEAVALVVLDVMLPGMNGFEALAEIRRRSNVPVLMLTTRGSTADRVRGLRCGADDYLPKPFDPVELLERVRSILRRMQPRDGRLGFLRVDDVEMDARSRRVICGGREVDLTASEFSLLQLLLSNAGTVLPREELVPLVLDRERTFNDRGIDSLASNLRRKLGPSTNGGERIRSVRGIGYVYVLADGSIGR